MKSKIKIGRASVNAEIVHSFLGKARGLMLRRSMKRHEGMLFVFKREGRHGIWMFGMRFPIDIIWIDRNGIIVDIAKRARPYLPFCRIYEPKKNVKYVLEVNAGFAEKNNIRIGSKVTGI